MSNADNFTQTYPIDVTGLKPLNNKSRGLEIICNPKKIANKRPLSLQSITNILKFLLDKKSWGANKADRVDNSSFDLTLQLSSTTNLIVAKKALVEANNLIPSSVS
jgi:hypothetical protein